MQDDWYKRAQLAVEKGDDELAKEALKRRKSNQENADTMKAQLDQQRKAVDQLISNTKYALFANRRCKVIQMLWLGSAWARYWTRMCAQSPCAASHQNVAPCRCAAYERCMRAWVGRLSEGRLPARRMLEGKLIEAKSKKDTLKARAKTAQTSRQIADMVQGLNTSNAVSAFERMEEKVMSLEAEAESTLQVGLVT